MIGDPSMLRLIRKAAAFARIFPTLDLSIEEKAGKVTNSGGIILFLALSIHDKQKKKIRLLRSAELYAAGRRRGVAATESRRPGFMCRCSCKATHLQAEY